MLLEMSNGRPLFTGNSPEDQLRCIFKIMGTPTLEEWPQMKELSEYKVKKKPPFSLFPFFFPFLLVVLVAHAR